MASKDWTQEQRERAADEFSGEMMRTGHAVVTVTLACGDRVHLMEAELNTQCSLNRLQEQVKEARELIQEYESKRSGRKPYWPEFYKVSRWLDEEAAHD